MLILGVTLAVMAVISVAIFEFAIKGGVSVSMERGHVRTFKGEEYETVLKIESRGTDWIGSIPTTFAIETGQLLKTEPLAEGRVRLRFFGKYAGRSEGVKVEISLTDPLRLLNRVDRSAYSEFVLDTLPLSLSPPCSHGGCRSSGSGTNPPDTRVRGRSFTGSTTTTPQGTPRTSSGSGWRSHPTKRSSRG